VLIRELVATDFRMKYQSSVLGYVWSLLRPFFMFAIMYAFFGIFLGTGNGIPHYSSYLLLGILLWNFFAEVTGQGVQSVVAQASMLRKIHFPKYVIVLSVSVTALINLAISFIVLGVFMVTLGADVRWASFLVILLVAELALLAIGMSFFLSALYVKFRDASYIWEIALQAGFYVTPVFYVMSFVQAKSLFVAAVLMSNPIAQVIQDARYLMITKQTTVTEDVFSTGWYRLVPIATDLVVAALSIWYFKRQAPLFAEAV